MTRQTKPPSGGPAGGRDRRRAKPTAAARRRAAQPRRLRNRAVVAVTVVAVIAAVGLAVIAADRRHQHLVARLTASGCKADSQTDDGSAHISDPTYTVDPPTGGDHLEQPASPGFRSIADAPPVGQVVHSLEHGYVALWYRPDLPADQVSRVRSVLDAFPVDVVVVPGTTMAGPVAATAWHHRLLCPTADPVALRAFVSAYRNKGPEKVPHS